MTRKAILPFCVLVQILHSEMLYNCIRFAGNKEHKSNQSYCIKYVKIQVFTDPYSYTGEYGSVKTRVLAYFMQCRSISNHLAKS